MHKRRDGFSLIELLVVMAIISILMAMYASTLTKATRKAKAVATSEAFRQDHIGRVADNALVLNANNARRIGRDECRRNYHKTVNTSEGERYVTELCYTVSNEDEFEAYWHTLINPENKDELVWTDRNHLVASDPQGNEYFLRSLEEHLGKSDIPKMWEFLAVNLGNTTLDNVGINVLFSDGHVEYLPYPDKFPCCATVAKLSEQFVRHYL